MKQKLSELADRFKEVTVNLQTPRSCLWILSKGNSTKEELDHRTGYGIQSIDLCILQLQRLSEELSQIANTDAGNGGGHG